MWLLEGDGYLSELLGQNLCHKHIVTTETDHMFFLTFYSDFFYIYLFCHTANIMKTIKNRKSIFNNGEETQRKLSWKDEEAISNTKYGSSLWDISVFCVIQERDNVTTLKSNLHSIICQAVPCERFKTGEILNLLALKVLTVTYGRWSLTRRSKYSNLIWKLLVFLIFVNRPHSCKCHS